MPTDFTEKTILMAIREQLNASLKMLRDSAEACPESLWEKTGCGHRFDHVFYHTLSYVDLYIGDSKEAFESFQPPAFHVENLRDLAKPPEVPLPREDLLAYADRVHAKCQTVLDALTAEELLRETAFHWLRPMNVLSVLLYNTRHVMHHAGQLALMLRQETGKGTAWVGRVKAA